MLCSADTDLIIMTMDDSELKITGDEVLIFSFLQVWGCGCLITYTFEVFGK